MYLITIGMGKNTLRIWGRNRYLWDGIGLYDGLMLQNGRESRRYCIMILIIPFGVKVYCTEF